MGQNSRINNARSIIDSLADIEQTTARPGHYKCVSTGIGMTDDGRLGIYMSLQEAGGGDQHEVLVDGSEIDPEYTDPEDLVQWVVQNFGIESEDAAKRLADAGFGAIEIPNPIPPGTEHLQSFLEE